MGHICYVCKKVLKWNNLKWTSAQLISPDHGESQILPTGFTSEDRLCSNCRVTLQSTKSFEKEKSRKEDEKSRKEAAERERLRAEAAPRVKCYWCKKQKMDNQFALRSKWNLEDYDTCDDCNKIINGLTSIKLRELISLERNNSEKIRLMNQLHGEASTAAFQAGQKKYSDVFSGVAGAGIMGGFIPNSDTQHLENSAKQSKGSLELNLMDARQESIRISNLIKNEKNTLAKEYFFKANSNESETKVHSTNTMKTNESDDPVEILKIRLAKGEITVEEIYKIPKSFFHAGGLPNSPSEILKKRYATGEITLEEFNKIKENLEKF